MQPLGASRWHRPVSIFCHDVQVPGRSRSLLPSCRHTPGWRTKHGELFNLNNKWWEERNIHWGERIVCVRSREREIKREREEQEDPPVCLGSRLPPPIQVRPPAAPPSLRLRGRGRTSPPCCLLHHRQRDTHWLGRPEECFDGSMMRRMVYMP